MCQRSGKTRRFAVGTDSGFALSLINGGLDRSKPLATHIEAFKEGEEPIAFGPKSDLVDYGHGWKLRTVLEPDFDCGGNWIFGLQISLILTLFFLFQCGFRNEESFYCR